MEKQEGVEATELDAKVTDEIDKNEESISLEEAMRKSGQEGGDDDVDTQERDAEADDDKKSDDEVDDKADDKDDTDDENDDKQNSPEALKERIAELEKEQEKTAKDRDTYRDGLLDLKGRKRSLPGDEAEPKEGEEQTPEQIADRKVSKQVREDAIADFNKAHPDVVDEERWTEVMKFYKKGGDATKEGITNDLNDAYDLMRLRNGELTASSDDVEKEKKKAVAQSKAREIASKGKSKGKATKTSSKNENRGAKEMSGRFKGISDKDLESVDDSNVAEIVF